ncbi:MAG: hypothetical protein HW403_4 [Dehalococcoidia bacterium]|nr:hypothetical protein [Dehalococcoidia bacterium]
MKYLLTSRDDCLWASAVAFDSPYKPFPLPGDKPNYARDRVVDIKHIKLELSVAMEGRGIKGTASTTLAPINDGVSYVDFDSVELDITSVSFSSGESLAYELSDEKLRVFLGGERRAGEEMTVVVAYQAAPRRGLYFVGPDESYPNKPQQAWTQGEDEDSRYWFPCYDFPNEKSTSEVIVTVAARFFALSNGRLLGVQESAQQNTKTYHWTQEVPHSCYLITLVAGEYVEITDYVDGIPVQYYVPPGREEDARRSFGNTPDMLRFFADKIGVPYPYNKYAQIVVADFIFGGMENTTATTLTENTLHDARAHLDFSSEDLVAHELAHQWFGDLLTCRDWSHAWLNEGFATYFEALYKEYHEGRDEFMHEMSQVADIYIREDRDRYRRPLVTNVYHEPMDLFDRHLYEKGGVVLHMLRYVLGDILFWKAINHYVTKYREQCVVTADLQKAVEEATGRSLDWFFEQWVYKAGYPEYKVEYQWNEDSKTARVAVSQTQALDEATSLFRMPVEICFNGNEGYETFKVEVAEKEQSFHFPLKAKPSMVRFDPGNWILKSMDFRKPKEMLIFQVKNSEDAVGRIEAVRALGRDASPEAVEALKESLMKDGFWAVQSEAAKALGSIRSATALDALREGLSVSHPKARRAVVAALGEFKDEAAVDALLGPLAGDESYFVEAEAARSLGKTRSPRAFEAIQGTLAKDSFVDIIRATAFDGFAELKDERAVPIAMEYSQYGRHPNARSLAVACLGRLGDLAEGEKKDKIVDRLIELLDDPWLRVKLVAIGALEFMKVDRALPALGRLVVRDLDGRVQRRAREALARIRQGRDRADDVRKVQEDLDKMRDENRKLQDRLDSLEARLPKGDSTGS